MRTFYEPQAYKKIVQELHQVTDLVKDSFLALGFADRIDTILSLADSGEHELAYYFLCSNIFEFDMPVSLEAYSLFVTLWSEIGADIQAMEGKDWHYIDYLGTRDGFPTEPSVATPLPVKQPSKPKRKQEQSDEIDYPWDGPPVGVIKLGRIDPDEGWVLTPQMREAMDQLVQLGVNIYSSYRVTNFTFMLPNRLFPEQYKEVERLMDVIAEQVGSFVHHVDWYPHGNKFRIDIPRTGG